MQCTVAQNVRRYGEEARAGGHRTGAMRRTGVDTVRCGAEEAPWIYRRGAGRNLRREGAMQCTVAQNVRRYGEEARGDGLFTKRSGGKSENVVPEASIVDSARIDKPCSPPPDRTER